jgi:transposase
MSMKPQPIPEIPPEMVRVVRAVFPKGKVYVHLRDLVGSIYQDELFADLYPGRGQPAYAPWRLALVTIFQFMENLTDRQAADAVRSRLDWKYALSLELTDPGFDHTVLSEFRTRLVAATSRRALLGGGVRSVQRAWLAQNAWIPTNRLYTCAGENSCSESSRMCRGNAAPRPQCPGRCSSRLVAGPGTVRLVGTRISIVPRNFASPRAWTSANSFCIR